MAIVLGPLENDSAMKKQSDKRSDIHLGGSQ